MFNIFTQLQSRIVKVSSFQETINIGLNRQKIVLINRVLVIWTLKNSNLFRISIFGLRIYQRATAYPGDGYAD